MNCAEAADRIPWYPGPSLTPEERLAVALHTAGCPACRADLVAALADAERVRAALADPPGPPAALRAAVLAEAAPRAIRKALLNAARRGSLPALVGLALDPLAQWSG